MSESFMDRIRAQMNSALGQAYSTDIKPWTPPVPERHRHPVDTNRWDRRMYHKMRHTSSIDELVEDLAEGDGAQRPEFEPSPELVEGLWQTFWKAVPRLTPKRELERDVFPVSRILEEVLDNPKHQELQVFTANDEILTTMAVDAMGDAVREILARVGNTQAPEPPQPAPQDEDEDEDEEPAGGEGEPEEGEGEPEPEDEEGDGPEGCLPGVAGAGEPEEGDGDQPTPGQDGLGGDEQGEGEGQGGQDDTDLTEGADTDEFDPNSEEAQEQAEADWEQAYDDLLDGLDLDRLVDAALGDALDEVNEVESARKGIGLEDGEWKSMDPSTRLRYAKQFMTDEMKALAQMVGRMKRFALGIKATRINDVPHEAFDVELGNDLKRVLRPQFALLGHEGTKYEFFHRYATKRLLQFKMRGTEEVGKGPIAIGIDKSGSMKGESMNWALAVAEALRRFAQDEERDYYAIFFGNNQQRARYDFPQGAGPFEKVMSFLSVVADGGTQFDGVLTELLEKASTSFDGDGKGKADIVFITDGRANLSDEWIEEFNKERARVGVRLFSVYIGGAQDMAGQNGPLGLLQRISDVTIPVKELKPSAVREVFLHV